MCFSPVGVHLIGPDVDGEVAPTSGVGLELSVKVRFAALYPQDTIFGAGGFAWKTADPVGARERIINLRG